MGMAAALETLQEQIRKRDETIVELDRHIKRQQATIERMEGQMEDLLRRLYGRRSEKLDINQATAQKTGQVRFTLKLHKLFLILL